MRTEIGENGADRPAKRLSSEKVSVLNDRIDINADESLVPVLEKSLIGISNANPERLSALRYSLAIVLHECLLKKFSSERRGILVEDRSCPGLLCDALASNNGSSNYLRGALVSFEGIADSAFRAFVSRNKLPGDVLLHCFEKGERSFLLIEGPSDARLIQLPPAKAIESKRDFQALCALAALAQWLEKTKQAPSLTEKAAECIKAATGPEAPLLGKTIEAVTKQNMECAQNILPELERWFGGKLSIGESFTFGKVAALLSAHAPKNVLDIFYGWYHPRFKLAVGVRPENLTAEQIAEPATVLEGAYGLTRLGGQTMVALGTTGYASRKEGEADYFSIAACSAKERSAVGAVRVSVDSTAELPSSFEKRELTRQLGVTASLYLLCRLAGEVEGKNDRIAKREVEFLSKILSNYCSYGFRFG